MFEQRAGVGRVLQALDQQSRGRADRELPSLLPQTVVPGQEAAEGHSSSTHAAATFRFWLPGQVLVMAHTPALAGPRDGLCTWTGCPMPLGQCGHSG